ncbi:hypothetical protein K470DRAFT_262202 [Piedraia hortae CBS 480.64]|uniref:Uncharacterized protein n=1 Tax=Piedraia hortae CBS 480.64 TaxID=1314780 RepID=A0A6A7C7I5_9PEZI|nr:hypothetical protein K470DRAFT_262202 [Piedraia hortae CBS 480.64]
MTMNNVPHFPFNYGYIYVSVTHTISSSPLNGLGQEGAQRQGTRWNYVVARGDDSRGATSTTESTDPVGISPDTQIRELLYRRALLKARWVSISCTLGDFAACTSRGSTTGGLVEGENACVWANLVMDNIVRMLGGEHPETYTTSTSRGSTMDGLFEGKDARVRKGRIAGGASGHGGQTSLGLDLVPDAVAGIITWRKAGLGIVNAAPFNVKGSGSTPFSFKLIRRKVPYVLLQSSSCPRYA